MRVTRCRCWQPATNETKEKTSKKFIMIIFQLRLTLTQSAFLEHTTASTGTNKNEDGDDTLRKKFSLVAVGEQWFTCQIPAILALNILLNEKLGKHPFGQFSPKHTQQTSFQLGFRSRWMDFNKNLTINSFSGQAVERDDNTFSLCLPVAMIPWASLSGTSFGFLIIEIGSEVWSGKWPEAAKLEAVSLAIFMQNPSSSIDEELMHFSYGRFKWKIRARNFHYFFVKWIIKQFTWL